MSTPSPTTQRDPADCSTIEAARLLGMAVRSVQLMVDRGELEAWKTPGGHRRISRASLQRWMQQRQHGDGLPAPASKAATQAAGNSTAGPRREAAAPSAPRVLLIEDSKHYQNLVALLLRDQFPGLDLQVADDGIAGLAMAGQLKPDVLIVDILLPGIDGATLIMSLRSHRQFEGTRLVVITSLDEADRAPYRLALEGLPVVHKSRLVTELPMRLRDCLPSTQRNAA